MSRGSGGSAASARVVGVARWLVCLLVLLDLHFNFWVNVCLSICLFVALDVCRRHRPAPLPPCRSLVLSPPLARYYSSVTARMSARFVCTFSTLGLTVVQHPNVRCPSIYIYVYLCMYTFICVCIYDLFVSFRLDCLLVCPLGCCQKTLLHQSPLHPSLTIFPSIALPWPHILLLLLLLSLLLSLLTFRFSYFFFVLLSVCLSVRLTV